ncbi:MAG: Iron-sulfur cluster repair protein YtfE [Phycisphaerae bacterium]|nr:Iron-sulfur cluster repair protein YtfE [Phycisphaerae bacterium]
MATVYDTDTLVGDFVTARPSRARVFEQFGIDYCCGGRTPLAEAAAAKGLDAQVVLAAIVSHDAQTPSDEINWSNRPMTELADHIEQTHHAYLKAELPRLGQIVAKVAQVHGPNHAELAEVRDVFAGLRNEMEAHMAKEEQILFPMIRELETANAAPQAHSVSVANPIGVMEHEHDNAGAALARLRELTGGFVTPPDGCNTYRVMNDGLAALEADFHRHIHKENNILFPRAIAIEHELAG